MITDKTMNRQSQTHNSDAPLASQKTNVGISGGLLLIEVSALLSSVMTIQPPIHKVFLAIALRVRTLLTSATFRPYSGAEKAAPIVTQEFLNFMAESLLERAEQ